MLAACACAASGSWAVAASGEISKAREERNAAFAAAIEELARWADEHGLA